MTKTAWDVLSGVANRWGIFCPGGQKWHGMFCPVMFCPTFAISSITCRRWRNTSSVGEMLDELEWPSLEARRDQSSLLLFHKIHCGAVSIEKDKYMTPAHSLKTTRSSHSAQYRRHQTYSDALKNSFFPRTIPHWNSLPPSVANAQSTEEFRALII